MSRRFAFGQSVNRLDDLLQRQAFGEANVCFLCDSDWDTVPASFLRFLNAGDMRLRRVQSRIEVGDILREVGLARDRSIFGLEFSQDCFLLSYSMTIEKGF
jgi:hypothetical protein